VQHTFGAQHVLGAQQALSAQHALGAQHVFFTLQQLDFARQALQTPPLHFPQHFSPHALQLPFSQTGLFAVC
jgi:hypothetical protein